MSRRRNKTKPLTAWEKHFKRANISGEIPSIPQSVLKSKLQQHACLTAGLLVGALVGGPLGIVVGSAIGFAVDVWKSKGENINV